MNFFKRLDGLMGDYTVTLTITKEKEGMIVMFLPKITTKEGEKPLNIAPLTASGTAEDLDEEFLNLIGGSMPAIRGLQSSIAEYQKSIESEKKKLSEKKKSTDKSGKDKTDEKKKPEDPDIFSSNVDEETGEVLDDLDENAPFEPDPPAITQVKEKKSTPVKPKEVSPKKAEPKLQMEEPKLEEIAETPKTVEDDW